MTKDSITNEQIKALGVRAAIAGDAPLVELCERAQFAEPGSAARARCADTLNRIDRGELLHL